MTILDSIDGYEVEILFVGFGQGFYRGDVGGAGFLVRGEEVDEGFPCL